MDVLSSFEKDTICPDSLEFKKDYFVMGGKYGRVLFLKEYASYMPPLPVGHVGFHTQQTVLHLPNGLVRRDGDHIAWACGGSMPCAP